MGRSRLLLAAHLLLLAALVNSQPQSYSRTDYFGLNISTSSALLSQSQSGCANANTCDPAFCMMASNAACPLSTGVSNITDTQMQQKVAQARACDIHASFCCSRHHRLNKM